MNETKEVSKSEQEELEALLAKARKVDSANSSGTNVAFISMAQKLTQALDSDSDLYIEGLRKGDYFCQNTKTAFGETLRVIPLAFLRAFNHFADNTSNAKWLGVCSAADGSKFPPLDFTFPSGKKNYSIRDVGDGTVLRPVYWVPILLVDSPDFPSKEQMPDCTAVVLTFKSTASKVAAAWNKDAKGRGAAIASNVYTLGHTTEKSADGKNTWCAVEPKFEKTLLAGDDIELLTKALKASVAIGELEAKNALFRPFSAASQSAPASRPSLDAPSGSDDGELEDIPF